LTSERYDPPITARASPVSHLDGDREFADSPLEGDGFELLVRERGESGCRACLLGTGRRALLPTDFIGYPTEGYAFGDRGGRVAPPAADPSQPTGRVKRRDNQIHRARVL